MDKSHMKHLGKMRHALGEVAELTEFGNTQKYSPYSWLYHDDYTSARKFADKRMDSLARHCMLALDDMHSTDEETGQHHLAAVAWNALAILELNHRYGYNLIRDRFKPHTSVIKYSKGHVDKFTPNCS